MNPFDVLILARTKLKSHRIRTGITVGIAGLLFGLIIAVIFIVQGVFSSVDRYSDVGLNDRTILGVTRIPQYNTFNEYDHMADPAFVQEVETAYKADVVYKQSVAKKYSIEYDAPTMNPSPIGTDPVTKQKVITVDGLSHQIVQRIANERREALTKKFSIAEYVKPYSSAVLRGEFSTVQPTDGNLTYMKDDQESQQNSGRPFETSMMGGDDGAYLSLLDASISKAFVSDTTFDPSKGEIPVIIPFSTAEKLLDLSQLSKDATPNERRERLQFVRAHINEATASFCYRNNASQSLLSQAVAQQDELKRAVGNKDYVKPPVLYNVPDEASCGATTVQSDARSAATKKADANQISFEKEIGTWIGDPVQHLVKVRGVGISGSFDSMTSTLSISTLVSGLLNSSLGYNTWSIPRDLFEKVPAAERPAEIFNPAEGMVNGSPYRSFPPTYLVEFGDKAEARALLERTGAFTGGYGEVSAYPFGSGTLFVDEMRTWVERFLLWGLIVVGIIATIILWGIIGRTIADSRRESAVFRAIGATRLDITGIYGMYTLLLSLRVVLFALVLGAAIALLIDILFSDTATLGAQLAYAAVDTNIRFHFFSAASWYIPAVLGVIVLVGMIASIVPIALGARRNPISDMRDEN